LFFFSARFITTFFSPAFAVTFVVVILVVMPASIFLTARLRAATPTALSGFKEAKLGFFSGVLFKDTFRCGIQRL
jgi:hypothetical protein